MQNANNSGNPYLDLYIILALTGICFLIAVARGLHDQTAGFARWWKRPIICCGGLAIAAAFIGIFRIAIIPLAADSTWSWEIKFLGLISCVLSLMGAGLTATAFYIVPFFRGQDIRTFFD